MAMGQWRETAVNPFRSTMEVYGREGCAPAFAMSLRGAGEVFGLRQPPRSVASVRASLGSSRAPTARDGPEEEGRCSRANPRQAQPGDWAGASLAHAARRRTLLSRALLSVAAVIAGTHGGGPAGAASTVAAAYRGNMATAAASSGVAASAGSASAAASAEGQSGFISGIAVSVVKQTVLYPVDTVKVRMQTLPPAPGERLWSRAGLFKDVYRGFLVPLLFNAPAGGVFFAGKDAVKSALADLGNVPSTLIAIFFASFPYWLVRQPSERLKVRGQTALGEEELPGGVAGLVTGLRDSLRLLDVRQAAARESLYQGFGSNVAYTFPADAIKFVAYDYLKAEVKKKTNSKPDGLQAAVLGALASMAAQAATTPLDVARNRIMNSAQAATTASGSIGLARTRSAESDAAKDIARGRDYAGETSLSAMVRIYREEGAGSLMLGLTPRLLRAVLSGALQFSTYEFTKGKVSK